MQRYFIHEQVPASKDVSLNKETAHHFITVMRGKVGDQCELVFDGGRVFVGQLTSVEGGKVHLVKELKVDVELPISVTIACGLPKTKEKPEIIVQKATELGVDRVVFFESARSVSHWNSNRQVKKVERLQKIANGAAEQSHRTKIPVVEYRKGLKEVLNDHSFDQQVVAWEESAKEGETSGLAETFANLNTGQSLLAIFGPEGGLTEQEVSLMTVTGVRPVGLGPRILRTETAPLYLLAALSYHFELDR